MSRITLTLDENERALLERVLEASLGESRVEVRRTHFSPEYRAQVTAEESTLSGLLQKIRVPAKADSRS